MDKDKPKDDHGESSKRKIGSSERHTATGRDILRLTDIVLLTKGVQAMIIFYITDHQRMFVTMFFDFGEDGSRVSDGDADDDDDTCGDDVETKLKGMTRKMRTLVHFLLLLVFLFTHCDVTCSDHVLSLKPV